MEGNVMNDEDKKQKEQEELAQGFNDSELKDIMSEIESLEHDFNEHQTEEALDSDIASASDDADSDLKLFHDMEMVEKEATIPDSFVNEVDSLSDILGIGNNSVVKTEDLLVDKGVASKKTKIQHAIDAEISSMLEKKEKTEESVATTFSEELSEVENILDEMEKDSTILDNTNEDIQDITEDRNVVALKNTKEDGYKHHHDESTACATEMDFSVSGEMKLKLNFSISGQHIGLVINKENGLVIEMDGGAKFSLPINQKKAS